MALRNLLTEIRSCRICAEHLPLGPNPVLRIAATSRLVIVGQAPGTKVHNTSIPWNDPSGDRLRLWMEMDAERFYNEKEIAIIPMGFCYPGRGKSGDLPPRPECAEAWFERLWKHLKKVELTLLVGSYAQAYYLGDKRKKTLGETVKAHSEYGPKFFPLPHPSPRNNLWLRKNPWFETEVLPVLRRRVSGVLG